MKLGLTESCAKIWNYDGIYDGSNCLAICLVQLFSANNGPTPGCTLNDCLKCDEKRAGPKFSSFGGRTRRSSGLKSEIIRTCSSVYQDAIHNPCLNPSCGCVESNNSEVSIGIGMNSQSTSSIITATANEPIHATSTSGTSDILNVNQVFKSLSSSPTSSTAFLRNSDDKK